MVHFWLHHMDTGYSRTGSASAERVEKVGRVTHMQGAVHMATARLGCKRAMVGTEWAIFRPDCTNKPRKSYFHLLRGSFLTGKVAWALSGYLPTENAHPR